MSTNDGGAAFPRPNGTKKTKGSQGASHSVHCEDGMTLRDYFAGQALSGALSTPQNYDKLSMEVVTRVCYKFADSMLAQRSKEATNGK